MRKYGLDNFKLEIIEEREDLLDQREIFWIMEYRSQDHSRGYNIRAGGAHGTHSLETRAKLSRAATGRHLSDAAKEKVSRASKGRIKSADECKRISDAKKGQGLGRKLSEETRTKMKKNSGVRGCKWYTNGTKDIRCAECPQGFYPGRSVKPNLGRALSPEAKLKVSIANQGRLWFTNGTENKHCRVCPEGFWPGRVLRKEITDDEL